MVLYVSTSLVRRHHPPQGSTGTTNTALLSRRNQSVGSSRLVLRGTGMLQIQQLLFSGVPVGKGEKQMPMERTFKVCPLGLHLHQTPCFSIAHPCAHALRTGVAATAVCQCCEDWPE